MFRCESSAVKDRPDKIERFGIQNVICIFVLGAHAFVFTKATGLLAKFIEGPMAMMTVQALRFDYLIWIPFVLMVTLSILNFRGYLNSIRGWSFTLVLILVLHCSLTAFLFLGAVSPVLMQNPDAYEAYERRSK